MGLKYLKPSHLDKLIEAGKDVYVVNTSKLPNGSKGSIMVNFFDGVRREYFKMPPTFIPVCVSDSIPRNQLANRDFKMCLVRGMLTLVDPDSAADYLSTQEAQDEYEALMLSEHSQRSRGTNIENEVANRSRVSHNHGQQSSGPMDDTGSTDSISLKVRGTVERLVSGDISAKDAFLEFRRQQSALTTADIAFVQANVSDGKIRQWAKDALTDADESREVSTRRPVQAPAPKSAKVDDNSFDFGGDEPLTQEELQREAAARAQQHTSNVPSPYDIVEKDIDSLLRRG